MNWDSIFEWQLRMKREPRELLIGDLEIKTPPQKVYLKPDLDELKVAYNGRGILSLADAKPVGILFRAEA